MMKLTNKITIEGILYDHKLVKKVSKAGVPYIKGKVMVMTSDDKATINTVVYIYESPFFASGSVNSKYAVLENIVNGNYKTYLNGGDEAILIKIDSAIGRNEFYLEKGTQFISKMANMGGFLNIVDKLNPDEKQRNKFNTDVLITGVELKPEDVERNLPVRAILKGVAFSYKPEIVPIEYTAINSKAIDYFVSKNISQSNPLFTNLRGNETSTIIKTTTTSENAFGESETVVTERPVRNYVVTYAAKEPYVWDDPNTMTANDLIKFNTDRETALAKMKQDSIDYAANNNAIGAATPNPSANPIGTIQPGSFGF